MHAMRGDKYVMHEQGMPCAETPALCILIRTFAIRLAVRVHVCVPARACAYLCRTELMPGDSFSHGNLAIALHQVLLPAPSLFLTSRFRSLRRAISSHLVHCLTQHRQSIEHIELCAYRAVTSLPDGALKGSCAALPHSGGAQPRSALLCQPGAGALEHWGN